MIPSHKFKSNQVKKSQILKTVVWQTVEESNEEAVSLSFNKKSKMTYADFEQQAKKAENSIGADSIDEIENRLWEYLQGNVCEYVPLYAIDNEFTLFKPNSNSQWNLNAFTHEQSIIHGVKCQFILFFNSDNLLFPPFSFLLSMPTRCPEYILPMYTLDRPLRHLPSISKMEIFIRLTISIMDSRKFGTLCQAKKAKNWKN